MATIYENLEAVEQLLFEVYQKEQELKDRETTQQEAEWLKKEKEQILQVGLEKLCMVRQNKKATIEAFKNEENRIKEKRETEERKLENLENYISQILFLSGDNKKQAGTFTVSFRKSTQVIVDEPNFHDERFTTIKEVKYIDKIGIKEALKNGEKVDGAYLKENKNLQIK